MTTDIDRTGTTLTFPNWMARRFAEVAIERNREWHQTLHALEDDVTGSFERLGHVIDLGDGSYIVEIIATRSTRDEILWAAVVGIKGRRDSCRFHTRDEALLRAVELRNGGGPNSQGHVYAARMLGVKATADTEETQP